MKFGARVLSYIDDFLIAPSVGRVSTTEDDMMSRKVGVMLEELGLARHKEKGVWGEGTTRIENLVVVWDTPRIGFTETAAKVGKIRERAKGFLRRCRVVRAG